MNFVPRLKLDEIGNIYYKKDLPNTVSYAYGRFNEIGEYGKLKYKADTKGSNIFRFINALKLPIGLTPQLGALMVWQKNDSVLLGHMAIVEKVISGSEVLVSESRYGDNKLMTTAIHKLGNDGQWIDGTDAPWMREIGYKFMGFIYNPAVEQEVIFDNQGYNSITVKKAQHYIGVEEDGKWGPESERVALEKGFKSIADVMVAVNMQIKTIPVNGIWDETLTKYTQQMLKIAPTGIISNQMPQNQKLFIDRSIKTSSWKFIYHRNCYSKMVKQLQIYIGVKPANGQFDINTIRNFQKFLRDKRYYSGEITGKMDRITVKAWQEYLNNYFEQL